MVVVSAIADASVRRRFKEPVLVSGVGRPECLLFVVFSYHYGRFTVATLACLGEKSSSVFER